jgi:hypothetical protein
MAQQNITLYSRVACSGWHDSESHEIDAAAAGLLQLLAAGILIMWAKCPRRFRLFVMFICATSIGRSCPCLLSAMHKLILQCDLSVFLIITELTSSIARWPGVFIE